MSEFLLYRPQGYEPTIARELTIGAWRNAIAGLQLDRPIWRWPNAGTPPLMSVTS